MAARVARDIPEGAYVNLGIGLPTLVAQLPAARTARSCCRARTASSAWARRPPPGEEDPDLINAGKQPVTLLPGGSLLPPRRLLRDDARRPSRLSACWAPSRCRRAGDLANWHTGAPDAIPAVGGAMDLAIGARHVYVMMEHTTKAGESKIVEALHLSADRRRLRRPHLHRPRGDRRDARAGSRWSRWSRASRSRSCSA